MKIFSRLFPVCILFLWLLSCSVSGYITDPESIKRQKKMHEYRTGVNIGEGFLVMGSAISAAFTGVDFYPNPQQQSYRKMKLINESKDTLFVNLITDWQWKDSTYFDIREIVMPPQKAAKVIVPIGIAYNVYFRNDYSAPDDEKVEINTAQTGKVKLKPALEKSETIPGN
jgi:hypothetical protein